MADVKMGDEFYEVVFTERDLLTPELLESPDQWKLGGGEVAFENIRLTIGRRPVARSLSKLFSAQNNPLPPGLAMFFERYNVWLICQTVGIMDTGGNNHLKQLLFNTRLAETPRATILGVAPDTQLVKYVEGSINMTVDWLVTGEVSASMEPRTVMNPQFATAGEELLQGGARLRVMNEGHIHMMRLSLSCISPLMIATGPLDYVAEWLFRRPHDKPLVGTQMLAYTVRVPRWVNRLDMVTSVKGVIGGFMNMRVGTVEAEVSLECELD